MSDPIYGESRMISQSRLPDFIKSMSYLSHYRGGQEACPSPDVLSRCMKASRLHGLPARHGNSTIFGVACLTRNCWSGSAL